MYSKLIVVPIYFETNSERLRFVAVDLSRFVPASFTGCQHHIMVSPSAPAEVLNLQGTEKDLRQSIARQVLESAREFVVAQKTRGSAGQQSLRRSLVVNYLKHC